MKKRRAFTLIELLVVIAIIAILIGLLLRHVGGVNLLLGDGSVRFVSNGISVPTWRALSTRSGQEVIADPNY